MRRHRRRVAGVTLGGLLAALSSAPLAVHADTVASLLGNFTTNQYCGLELAPDVVNIRYAVVFGQLPALRELHVADTNGDGVTTQTERDAYAGRLAPTLAQALHLTIDGSPIELRAVNWTSSLPTEQGGFSLRLDAQFSAPLPRDRATHTLTFANDNYPDQFGWDEITVQPSSMTVFDTGAFSSSLTAALTAAVQSLPTDGPLAERRVSLRFTPGPAPAGARLIQPRAGSLPQARIASAPSASGTEQAWLERRTRALADLISAPRVAPGVMLMALLIAFVLGAAHALSPGHGKTIVGAYLIGSRGTPRHALFLGTTVTVTHTLGVFLLGFATLAASRFFVPERLFPILSLISGVLVLTMGVILLVQRWRAARHAGASRAPTAAHAHHHEPVHAPHPHTHHENVDAAHDGHEHPHHHDHHHDHGHHDHPRGHDHDQEHEAHSHAGVLTHSHGGSVHSHLPPGAKGEEVSWRSLLALGVSGGLVPCPSAMVLLLAAVALNKTAYGLLLVVAFSLGLAATLTLVGLMFLFARNRFRTRTGSAPWMRLLPVASAATITVIGAVLCVAAAQTFSGPH
jgi:nickel/cobalt transporter (NicO) family protein